MKSYPLWIRDVLYDETLQDFVDNFSIKITNCNVCIFKQDTKHVFYRLRIHFKPTGKTMYITFQNQLDAYAPPHVSKEDVIICLNADLLWWHEGSWCINRDGTMDNSYKKYKQFYVKYKCPYYTVQEYILYRNEVINLTKVLGSFYEPFYYLPF